MRHLILDLGFHATIYFLLWWLEEGREWSISAETRSRQPLRLGSASLQQHTWAHVPLAASVVPWVIWSVLSRPHSIFPWESWPKTGEDWHNRTKNELNIARRGDGSDDMGSRPQIQWPLSIETWHGFRGLRTFFAFAVAKSCKVTMHKQNSSCPVFPVSARCSVVSLCQRHRVCEPQLFVLKWVSQGFPPPSFSFSGSE